MADTITKVQFSTGTTPKLTHAHGLGYNLMGW